MSTLCRAGQEHSLLDCERTRVDLVAEDLEVRHGERPETAHRERQQLSDEAADLNTWVTEEEELVEARHDWTTFNFLRVRTSGPMRTDSPDDADDPSAKGVDGHVRIVCVGDGGTNLRVWAVQ